MACAAPEGTPPRRFNYLLMSKKQVHALPGLIETLMVMNPPKIPFFILRHSFLRGTRDGDP